MQCHVDHVAVIMQGPPMTPEESYEPPADPSPTSQPPSQESSLSHYPDTAHSHAPIYSQVQCQDISVIQMVCRTACSFVVVMVRQHNMSES